ncbi:MAG: 50S ribosomal protein L9 [Deltaproteobacteria bacterium]|nr:50S ribosomal protein L9 [Deltaproteobacteria bacterium]
MRLILTEDVANLGSLGDAVEVKAGYGRNYLIPQGKALLADNRASKELQHRLTHLEKLRQGKIALAQEQAAKIKELQLEVVRKAGQGGRLFGSVTIRDILQMLADQGYDFDRKAVTLHAPIRNVGSHELTIRVHTEVRVSLSIKVIGEIEPGAAEVAEETAEASEDTETGEENPETVEASAEESQETETGVETEASA